MPELPDVEVFKRYADATSLHRRIDDVFLRERLVTDTDPQTIREHLRGASLTGTRRHGKHLFLHADDDGWLRLHFGMTGHLDAYEEGDEPEHTELRVDFTGGRHLAYVNERTFGAISWVVAVDVFVDDHDLGPDLLSDAVDEDTFVDGVSGHRGSIKGTLMNQEIFAGLGNVYVDEVLFQAGIHPESQVDALGDGRLRELHRTLRRVVDEAIERHADVDRLPDSWLLPHREPDAPCPRDDGHIERIEVVGRSTYLCSRHQARID